MPLAELARIAGITVVTLGVALLFDMLLKYKVQLVYGAAVPSPEPQFRIKPAPRHFVLFLLACSFVYLYRNGVTELSSGVVVFLILLVLWGTLAGYDALQDLRQRRTD